MGKSETLRGRGAFDALFAAGLRANASLIRCLYRFGEASPGSVQVGFAVPRKSGTAVRRNRVRRLMREAYRKEDAGFRGGLSEAGRSASLVFVYRGTPERARGPLGLEDVHRDVRQLCHSVLATANRVSP